MKKRFGMSRLAGLVFAILAVMGFVFGGSVLAADNNTISKSELINGLGFARNFGIVARNWTMGDHSETSVYVENAALISRAFTNTDNDYRSSLNYTATVSKTGNVSATDTFKIALFTKDSSGNYSKVTGSEKTISKGSPVTYQLKDFSSNLEQSYYVFELDASGNPVSQNGQNGSYKVTYSSDNGTNTVNQISALNNTSYIKNFSGGISGTTPFNTLNNNPYIVFGSDVQLYRDASNNNKWTAKDTTTNATIFMDDYTDSVTSQPKYATTSNSFPVDFDMLFTTLNTYAKKLANLTVTDASTTAAVRVIDVTAATDSQDATKATLDNSSWKSATGVSDSEKEEGLCNLVLADNQYAVINVIVPQGVDKAYISKQLQVKGNGNSSYEIDGSRILYNFCTIDSSTGALIPYGGYVEMTVQLNGLFLAPSGSLKFDTSSSGAYIAKNVTSGNEAHFIQFGVQDNQNDMTVNNATESTTVSASVTKTWNDGDNQDGLRPDKVTVRLFKDGNDTGKSMVLSAANGWTESFDGLDQNGNYTVKEDTVDSYLTTVTGDVATGFKVTNTHTPSTVEKTATKVWDDNDNAAKARPASVTLQLYAGSEAYGDAVTLTANGSWKYTWKDLPEYKSGQKIVYTVKETSTVDNYAATYSNDTFTVTNKYTPKETTDIKVNKVWSDSDNQDGLRPDKVTVHLLAGGTDTGKTLELNKDNNWSGSFNGLDKGPDYSLKEAAVDGYSANITGTAADGFTITNSHTADTVEKTVAKIWDDSDSSAKARPASIKVQLYADGVAYGDAVTLTEAGSWQYTWSTLPKNKGGKAITYTVAETSALDNYSTSYSDDTFTITNKYTPKETTNVNVTKVWKDSDNQDGIRPDKVTVRLLAGGTDTGKTLELSKDNNWSGSFSGLDKGPVYTVSEDTVTGYESAITGTAADGFTITNSHTADTVEKTVTKIWDDSDNGAKARPASIKVQLYADGTAYGDVVTLTADSNWQYAWSNLPKNKGGQAINYTVAETSTVDNYTTSYSTDTFAITNKYTPKETTNVNVTKVWKDGDNQDGIRPDKVTVRLLAGGTDTGKTLELSKDNNWSGSFSGLDKGPVYTVSEDTVTGYESAITGTAAAGFTITNSHTPSTVEKTVTKVWNDNENAADTRPASVSVQLYAGNEVYGDAVTLTANESWNHTWSNLPEYKGGQKISYTVKELNIDSNYTATVKATANGFTVTNTLGTVKGNIAITKVDASNPSKKLSGAVYGVYSDKDCASSPVTTIQTTANGGDVSSDLPIGTYYVKEVTAPVGYTLDTTVYPVEVKYQKTVTVGTNGTVADTAITLNISKQILSNGAELPGATLKIVDAETNVVVKDGNGKDLTWVSGTSSQSIDTANFVSGHPYILVEETAPDGYNMAEALYFKVSTDSDTNGKILVYDSANKKWNALDDHTVVMKDAAKPATPTTPTTPTTPAVTPSTTTPTATPSTTASQPTTVNPTTPYATPSTTTPSTTTATPSTTTVTPNSGTTTSTTAPTAATTTTTTSTGSSAASTSTGTNNVNTGVAQNNVGIILAALSLVGAIIITAIYKRKKED